MELQKLSRYGLASMVAVVMSFFGMATSAHADIDVSSLVAQISGQVANIETIGMAILGVLVVITGIALLRRIIH